MAGRSQRKERAKGKKETQLNLRGEVAEMANENIQNLSKEEGNKEEEPLKVESGQRLIHSYIFKPKILKEPDLQEILKTERTKIEVNPSVREYIEQKKKKLLRMKNKSNVEILIFHIFENQFYIVIFILYS